jgi:dolichyl-phosphate-mannose--protein O-mannosyl transferase
MADARHRGPDSIGYRWMTAGIGAILVACSALIVTLVPFSDWLAMIAAGVLFALGADALVAAKVGRWSVLSRIGPLP